MIQPGESIRVTAGSAGGGKGQVHMIRNQVYLNRELLSLLDIRDRETEMVHSRLQDGRLYLKRSEHGNKVGESNYVTLPLGLKEPTEFTYVGSDFDGRYDVHEFEMIECDDEEV